MMKYRSIPAILYDSIYYLITHFVKNDLSTSSKNIAEYSEVSDILEKISASVEEPPLILSPFFACKDGGVSILSLFFRKNVDFESETLDSFVEKLRLRSDLLYQDCIAYIFEEYENNSGSKVVPILSPGKYIDAIQRMNASPEFKLQVALLLGNFAYAVEILIENIRLVYAEVEKVYAENAEILIRKYESIHSDEEIAFLAEKIKYDKRHINTTTTSVTLLNQSLVYVDETDNGAFLMLGLQYKEQYQNPSYIGNTELIDFIIACGSKLRMKMLQGLAEEKEMTLSAFAKYVGSSPTTVIRNLRILEDSGIIGISRKEAQQIFYKVDMDMLKRVKYNFNRFIDNFNK